MSWELRIYNQNRSTLLRTLTPAAPGGLVSGVEWQLLPSGDCVNMQFTGRNDLMQIPPRAVVQLVVDGVARFTGIAADVPSLNSPDIAQVVVSGGREALRLAVMDSKVYRRWSVRDIAIDVLDRLAPPSLIVEQALIQAQSVSGDSSRVLETFYSPGATLEEVTDSLAESIQVKWGVNATGKFFFDPAVVSRLTIPYAGQPWRRLPIQGREAVTQARVRVASAPSSSMLYASVYDANQDRRTEYIPGTVETVVTAPEHSLYNASISAAPPEGTSLVRDRFEGTRTANAMSHPNAGWTVHGQSTPGGGYMSAYRTPDTATGPAPGITLRSSTDPADPNGCRAVGARITYHWNPREGQVGRVVVGHAGFPEQQSPNDYLLASDVSFDLPGSNALTTLYLIAPPSADVMEDWQINQIQVYILSKDGDTAPADFSVADFCFLEVNEPAAEAFGQSLIQLPFTAPAEITLTGLQAPSPEVEVTGTPDGDVLADAALYVYKIMPDGGRQTLIRLGNTGQDPAIRALKLAVSK